MNVVTITYDTAGAKWSGPIPSQLDSERTLVLVFGPVELLDAPKPIAEIVRSFPRSQVIGCSTGNTIVGKETQADVLTVTITQFEKTTMSSAQAQHAEAFTAGQMIGKKLSKPSLRAVLVFADGVEVSGAELVRGLNSTLDQSMVVIGGLAGDGTRFRRTWVLSGSNVKSGIAAAVGLYGEHIVVAHAARSGWTKLGDELTVSKSDGRVIYELNGRPALSVYEERIAMATGTGATQVPPRPLTLPLAVRASARHDRSLVRTVLSVDAAKQSITLAADVPTGYLVQPLHATAETLLQAAREASSGVTESAAPVGKDALILAITHPSRRIVLGQSDASDDEIATAIDALPAGPTAHVTGFYGLGEVAPSQHGHSDLNNQSFSVAMIMESPTPIARKGSRGLVQGATRAQAPSTASGPAAHLRSRHQTVDDLFSELELEGGDRRPPIRPKVGAPPPVPLRRPSGAIRAPSVGVAYAGAAASPGILPPPSAPVSGPRAPVAAPAPIMEEEEATLSLGKFAMKVDAFGYDVSSAKWTTNPLPTAADSPQTLVLAFGESASNVPLQELIAAYPKSHVLGCSSPLLHRIGAKTSIGVNTIKFAHTKLATAWADLALGGAPAGQSLAQKLVGPDLRAILVFADGTGLDSEAFVGALISNLPANVKVIGGIGGGGAAPWVLCNSIVRPGIAAAIAFYGDHILVANGVRAAGFEGFGPERQVTRAVGNVVYELDGRPALAVYAEYLRSAPAPNTALPFPLGMRRNDELVARMPIAFDPTSQSITFAGDVPNASSVRLMRGSHERLLTEVGDAAKQAAIGAVDGAGLALAISSLGRGQALGERAEEEVEVVLESMPRNVQPSVTGFYSVAEIGEGQSGRSGLSNEGISLTLITESTLPLFERGGTTSDRRTTPAPPLNNPPPFNPIETPSPAQVIPRSGGGARSSGAPSGAPPMSGAVSGRRRAEVVRSTLAAGGGPSGGTGPAKITRRQVGDIMVVSFAGRLSESFKGDAQGRELAGTVIFDLGNVERITSFGVREWLQMLSVSQDRVKKIYFAHCSEPIVNQLSMIRKFAGTAQVVSFFAPYLCDSCGEQFERLFDCEHDAEAIRSNDPPESVCQQCSGRGRFDDDAETYFAFGPNHVGQSVPANVRAVLNELDTVAPATPPEAIEKVIDGDVTRVRVKTKLGGGLRWQRILDGIEGGLVIDLGGVASLDASGVGNFEHALSALGSEVEFVRIERCPQSVVERFATSGLPKRVSITSTTLAAFCSACNVQRPSLLVVEEHAHSLAAGRDPTMNCKRCNGALTLVDAAHVTQFLARQRNRLSLQPRQASTPPPPPVSAARTQPSMSAFPGPPQLPAPETMAPQQPPSGRGVIAGAAILSVAILASAGFFAYARSRAAPPEPAAEQPKAAASWSKLTDLPPGWVERPFVEENGTFFIVGRCERAATPELALAAARNEAITRIVQQLYTDLTGTTAHDYLTTQAKLDPNGSRSVQIAEKYLKQTGTIAQPDRGETVVRQKEGGVEAFARYRLSRASYTQVRTLYSATVTFQGLAIARAFPLIDTGKDDVDLVVASVSGNSKYAATITPGSFFLSVNGRPLRSLEAVTKTNEEWTASPPNTTFEFEVRMNTGATETFTAKKPAPLSIYRTTAPPPPPPRQPQPAPPPRDLGIIPPPRSF